MAPADAWSAGADAANGGVGNEPEIDFFAFILTGGSWPYTQSTGPLMQLPLQLTRCVEAFSAFYDAKYKRRKLTWLHDLGHGEVLFRCADNRQYALNVSTCQIAILMLFNRQAEWTVESLLSSFDLDFQELVLCLYPLIKSQVLLVSPNVALASQLSRHHIVAVNAEFNRRSSRMAIPRKCDEAELPTTMDSPRSMDPGTYLGGERKACIFLCLE